MGEENRGRRRVAIVGVSSLVLVAMVVAVTVGINSSDDSSKTYNRHDVSATAKAIKTICQPTDYQEVCETSISSAAGNTSDPKELVRIGFEVAIQHIKEAMKNSTVIKQLRKDPQTKKALDSCEELAGYAVNDLKRSFDHLGEFDFTNYNEYLSDLKTWLSGAITYQETCLDGFEDTNGDAGERMREVLKTATQLTSNALAMVTEISSALTSLTMPVNGRRLLSEDLPVIGHDKLLPLWMSSGNRRLIQASPAEIKPDLVVAKDGSGKYKTINEALVDIPRNKNKTFVLYIKEGVYEEKVTFYRNMTHLMVIGDGPTKTRITGRLNWVDGTPTFQTATVVALGDYFIAKDIGFENTAGPEKHQAVALRVGADMSIFYNCHVDGYQDTLYAHTYRQYYRDCVISGTIDFIFGDSSAVFQNCTMLVRKPMDNQQCIVTAQGRKERRQPTGLVLQNCTITADPLYYPVRNVLKSYLGRPWKEFSRTIIMESYIDDLIQPNGYLPWNATFGLDTIYYAEYNNRGPGSSKKDRVQWRGIKHIGSARVQSFTASQFIAGDTWVPSTKVPYTPGLIYPPPADDINDASEPDEDFYSLVPAAAPAFSPQQPQITTPPTSSPAFSPEQQQIASPPASSPAFSPELQIVSPSRSSIRPPQTGIMGNTLKLLFGGM